MDICHLNFTPNDRSADAKMDLQDGDGFLTRMRRLSMLKRDELFELNSGLNFSNNLGEMEQDPFIGYVGRNYFAAQIKICFLGKSNAESNKFQAQDRDINTKLVAFRNASIAKSKTAYENYRLCYEKIIPEWKIGKYPAYLLEKLGMSFLDISYANIVPFRYVKEPPQTVYGISFENFTTEFLDIVSPDIVVPLGKRLHKIIKKHYQFPEKVEYGITRTIGDSYIPKDSSEYMNDLARKIMG